MPGLIERYMDRLPFSDGDPIVTLEEGSTPLVRAPRLSERVGADVWLKIEGANPTGSFKDRGMTCAVSAAVREGAEAVICASTGNTAAALAAYAARAGIRGVVIVPEGKIAMGKLAQALMHGAQVIAIQGNFDHALQLVRTVADQHPIALVNSVNEFRIEGQKTAAFEIGEALAGELDALCIPVGNAGNITAYWRGFSEIGMRPRMFGFQAAGAAPLVLGSAGRAARDDRERDPDRQPRPLGAGDGCHDLLRRRGQRRHRRADPRGLPLPCASRRASSASRPRRPRVAGLIAHGAGDAERVACVLTGPWAQGSRHRAVEVGGVIPCEPELSAIERAVLR